MARVDEKQVAVALVYCRSMLDLAESGEQAESLLEDMRALVAVMEQNENFRDFLVSPLVDAGDRERILEKLLRGRLSDLLVNSLLVLNRHGRLGIFETLAAVYRTQYQERHGEVDVHVSTAVPLSNALRRELEAAIQRLVGRIPKLIPSVDESLIGGLVIRVGDRKIDTSVARALRNLRGELGERASQQIYESRTIAE
ncbi:MAG: ATP synthase F1 subunit delta [Thermoanaerobaculia bacterium]